MLHKLVVGESHGQIMLNFDQCKVETLEAKNIGKIDENIQNGAKNWKLLYEPDYKTLFNH